MTNVIIDTNELLPRFRSPLVAGLPLLLLSLAACGAPSETQRDGSAPGSTPAEVAADTSAAPTASAGTGMDTSAPVTEFRGETLPGERVATKPPTPMGSGDGPLAGNSGGTLATPTPPSAADVPVLIGGMDPGTAPPASDNGDPTLPAPSAAALPYKFTPDVLGYQPVLAVGCRFADTNFPDLLDYSNSGVQTILAHTHDYFDIISDHRVNFQGEFVGWRDLPKSSGDYTADDATRDCEGVARGVLAERGARTVDYRAIVMLFNRDIGLSNQTQPDPVLGTYVRLRYSGGVGGGWTSEALWAHELGHAFGLSHSTFPVRADGYQYNDFQDPMSGFAHSAEERWNFPVGGVCNGMFLNPECIYSGQADQMPVHYSAFQKQRLGWLAPDQMLAHAGGTSSYQLVAPTSAPNDESVLERLKMVYVQAPSSAAYYAIEFRRGNNHGDASDAAAVRRGWDAVYEKGIRSDRVTVYYIDPVNDTATDDLGDANLMAVLNPGETFDAPGNSPTLHVSFDGIVDASNASMHAAVTVTTP